MTNQRVWEWKRVFARNYQNIRANIHSLQMPSIEQWKKSFFGVFSPLERVLLSLFLFSALISLGVIAYTEYLSRTAIAPAKGGSYSEALIGQPRFLNPVLAAANDADRDITELVFSGLLAYNSKGDLVPDLAERYEISEEGKVYDFFLRKDVKWHDGVPFDADDVVFTIQTIQNSDYKSPVRANWTGVRVEKVNAFQVRFILRAPYPPFLETATQKIIPRHIWKDIPPAAFPLAYANLEPVGTGPFVFQSIASDSQGFIRSVSLLRNEGYHGKKAYIKELTFYFFPSEKEAWEALKRKDVKGMQFLPANFVEEAENRENLRVIRLSLPRTFSVFFNANRSEILKDKRIREALLLATDKSAILQDVFRGEGEVLHSLFPDGFFEEREREEFQSAVTYNPEAAAALLENAGWKYRSKIKNQKTKDEEEQNESEERPEESARKEEDYRIKIKTERRKEGRRTVTEEIEIPLEITLVTAASQDLEKMAALLKSQWEEVGFKVRVVSLPLKELQEDWIKPRAYDALLFGHVFRKDPDPFVFWHSSQKNDPGLNLSMYENEKADTLLEEARRSPDEKIRKEKYAEFARELQKDIPAIFLVSPKYLYVVSSEIQGIQADFIVDPSKRFVSIPNWFIETKRVFK